MTKQQEGKKVVLNPKWEETPAEEKEQLYKSLGAQYYPGSGQVKTFHPTRWRGW